MTYKRVLLLLSAAIAVESLMAGLAVPVRADAPPSCYCCTQVSIGDVGGFWYESGSPECTGWQDYTALSMCFRLNSGTNPDDSLALYVADNPAGPARLVRVIKPIDAPPPVGGSVSSIAHPYPLPASASYYYWIDHGAGNFPAVRRPGSDLYENDNNPIYFTWYGYPPREALDPPDIVELVDPPFDRGFELTVSWSVSADDSIVDYYNVYREDVDSPYQTGYRWLASVSLGTTSFRDTTLSPGYSYSYQVSAAHNTQFSESGMSDKGIWNDFSGAVTGSPVDDFALVDITLVSSDTLTVCPTGGLGGLEVEETISGSNGEPSVGVPPEMLACSVLGDSVGTCDTLVVSLPTDSYGTTVLSVESLGGHGRADLVFGLAGGYLMFDTVTVYLRSPDENGDGVVSLGELGQFSSTYQSPPHTYVWYRDYNGDGLINLADYAVFTTHYQHECDAETAQPEVFVSAGTASVNLGFSEIESASSPGLFYADVTVADLPRFSVMQIMLRSDHPSLEFVRWEPGAYSGRVLVTPIVRDGVPEIAIGVLDGASAVGSSVGLGRLVYEKRTADNVILSETDFQVRTADVLTEKGTARISRSSSATTQPIQRVFVNELAQNYPNPFNPRTTISFSLASPARTELRIFDVRGAAVKTLVRAEKPAGIYHVDWDGRDDRGRPVASGVYFYKIVAGSFTDTKKMTILK